MSAPRRIQLSRKKGWRLPPNTVVVARPTKWGNPFHVGIRHPPNEAVHLFHEHVVGLMESGTGYPLRELRGKNLACWCPLDQPCHADVLLELANKKVGQGSTL